MSSACFASCVRCSNPPPPPPSSSSASASGAHRSSLLLLRLHPGVQPVTIAVLGARGVGKTSIVEQFMRSEFCENYESSETTQTHYTSVIMNDHMYELKIIDCPGSVRFPVTSIQEWNDHRGVGLRSASAYVIVYDVTDEDSFRYARSLRERIVRGRRRRNAAPASCGDAAASAPAPPVTIVVVANKVDLQVPAGGAGAGAGAGAGTTTGVASFHGPAVFVERLTQGGSSRRDLGNVVRKQWKCAYAECSAKYNWRIVALFRDLVKAVDSVGESHHRMAATSRVQEALRNNRCVIL